MPLVSIIVPVYNAEHYLRRCVDSLLAQTLEDIEIILVNDASPDGSLDIMNHYQKIFPGKIAVIDSPVNLRQGGARNIGIKAAKSEYIGFVDSDDWVSETMFETLYHVVAENGLDMAGVNYFIAIDGKQPYPNKETNQDLLSGISNKKLDVEEQEKLFLNSPSLWCNLYRKSVIIDNELFFPEKLAYEDNYFVRLYTLYVNKFRYIDECHYYYYQNTGSTIHQKNQHYQFDRLEIERLKIKAYKERNLYGQYKQAIEIDFLILFYANTIGMIFNGFDQPPVHLIKEMTKELKTYFPDFKKNPYYKNYLTAAVRLKITLARISPLLLIIPYKIKKFWGKN